MGPNERLERSQRDFFWVPDDAEVLDRPDLAAVRCPRALPHFNMVTRTRVAADDAPRIVAEASAWLGQHRSRWLVPDTFDRAPLEDALAAARWSPVARYEARAIRPADYARRANPRLEVRRVVTLEGLRDCIFVAERAFGRAMEHTDAALAEELAQCDSEAGRVHRYVVYRDGAPIASGGFNLYPDLAFAFLWAGGTVPEARGAGAYTALVAARVEAAAALGAEWVGLYAKDDTSAPIVARQGFEPFGEMRYWAPWTVRPATVDDVPFVQDVERSGGQRFREVGLSDIAAMNVEPAESLERAVGEGRLFVLDLGGIVAGAALTTTLDGDLHLAELDVDLAYQGRGFGRALVDHVLEVARAAGRPGVTLHTFRDVPFNAPLYRHLGFVEVARDAMGPELAAHTDLDAAELIGRARVCMRRTVDR